MLKARSWATLFALTVIASPAMAQATAGRTTISGVVTDVLTKQPIVGVTVAVFGTPHAAATNDQGRFTIVNVPTGNTVAITAQRIGYGPTRKDNVKVTGEAMTIDLVMNSAPLTLEAITSSATVDPTSGIKAPFAIAKLTAEQMPVPSMGSAAGMLAGKIAGVQILRAGGEPGSGSFVQLRTPQSPFHTNSPLYVIDGVPLSDAGFTGTITMDFESMDIESIEVIKGAAAAALYGSRGANGVIDIKTNRGKSIQLGRSQLTVKSLYAFDNVSTVLPKLVHHNFRINSTGQWIDANGNIVPRASRTTETDGIIDNPYPVLFDNVGQVFKPGRSFVNSVSLGQSSAATNLNVNFDRNEQQGLNIEAKPFLRSNFRATVDHNFRDDISIGVTATHSRVTQNPDQLSYTNLYRIDPDVDLLQKNNDGSPYRVFADSASTIANPLYLQHYRDNQNRRVRSLINTNANYRPLNWLSLTGDFSYDRNDRVTDNYTPPGLATDNNGAVSSGSLSYQENEGDTYAASMGATFLQAFGGLTARFTTKADAQRERALSFSASGSQFAFAGLRDMAAALTKTTSSSTSDIRTQSVYGALGLDYKGKYIGDFLLRHEGSSLFGPQHRWNDFYRVAGAYLMSSEDWFVNLPSFVTNFSTVKVRYSVGTAGNRPSFSDQYELLNAGTAGLIRSTLGSPFIAPEIKTEQEMGLDLIYKNRLSFVLTRAISTANNTLVEIAVPSATGFNTGWVNVGKSRGDSWEGTVEGSWITKPNFRWSSNFVVDKNKENQLEYNRPCYIDGVRWRCDNIPLSTMWGRHHVTATGEMPQDAATQAALSQFVINDEGYMVWVGAGNNWTDGIRKNLWGTSSVINGVTYRWGEPFERAIQFGTAEAELIGDGQPDFNYGIGNRFTIKGVRIYGLVRGQIGGEMYNNLKQNNMSSNDWYEMDQTGRPDSLKKTSQYYVRGVTQNNADWLRAFIEPGDWLKFTELNVSYTLDRQKMPFIRHFGADRVNLDFTGRDLFTVTRFGGLDPEAGNAGVSTRVNDPAYPVSRSFTTGITIIF